ncbi:TolC family protein [Sulfurospirillum sp. 1307]
MKKLCLIAFLMIPLFAKEVVYKNLDLNNAISILKKENLEINVARFEEKIKSFEHDIAKGYNYGKLDLIQNVLRSNDAGNVFGFKLQSREASFADFGFSEFLAPMGAVLENMNSGTLPAGFTSGMSSILDIQPEDLNYPKARNHFQTKLHYEVPIYVGGKLEQYGKITKALAKMSKLDTSKITSEKIYQLKKSYFDIYLLDSYLHNLDIIKKNMDRLENMAQSMIDEGYAKRVDLLEVQSKKANVVRMINKAKANKELVYHFLSFLLNAKVESIVGNYEKIMPKMLDTNAIIQRNLDIKKAKEGLAITDMAIELEKSAYKPQIGGFVEYGSSDDKFLNDFTQKDSYTIGVQLKWNLFNGGIDKANIEKARVKNLQVKSQVNLAIKGITLQVEKIKTEIKSYDFDIASLEKEIELTRSIYKNYLGRYQEKLVSINDVLIKQSLEIEKVLKLKEIQNNRSSKILELEKIANGEVE